MKLRNQIILCVLVAAALLTTLVWTATNSLAQNQTTTSAPTEAQAAINGFLFRDALVPVNPSLVDTNEAAAISSIFSDARAAWNQGYAASTDQPAFRRAAEKAVMSELESFLAAKPQSVWAPSTHNRLGDYYRNHGQMTKALAHYEAAWNGSRSYETAQAKAEAHTAYAWWTRLLVIFGRTDTLGGVYKQYGAGQFNYGPYSAVMARTHEKYIRMLKYPQDSYKCGIYALDQMAHHLALSYARETLLEIPGKVEGFSLAELESIAASYQFGFVAVRRAQNSQALPIPSIIHWKQEHFATIVAQVGGLFQINDPSATGTQFLTAEEVNAEATGYFLVPLSLANGDFQNAPSAETTLVIGRVSSCPPNDLIDICVPGQNGSGGSGNSGTGGSSVGGGNTGARGPIGKSCTKCSGGGGGGGGGGSGCCESDLSEASTDEPPGSTGDQRLIAMPSWSVSEPFLNLWVSDIPLLYRPSKGPLVRLKLSYAQRSDVVSHWFGYYWRSDWDSRIDLFATDGELLVPGGNLAHFEFPTGSNISNPTVNNWVVERIPNGGGVFTGLVARLPSGSEYRYYHQDSAEYPNSRFYLAERADPAGNKLTFAYDATDESRISSITDADGGVTSLTMTTNSLTSTYVLTITTPDSRSAVLTYDYSRRLTGVTDAVGISSSFTYGAWMWLESMTTPYGTTTFTSGYGATDYDRSEIVTLPTGGWEVWALVQNAPTNKVPTDFLTSQLPTNTPYSDMPHPYGSMTTNRNQRNTFYWNPSQFGACSTTNIDDLIWADFKRGRMKHWLREVNDAEVNHVGPLLGFIQFPSPDGSTEGNILFFTAVP